MNKNDMSANRRTLLRGLVLAPGAVLLVGVGAAEAAGTVPKVNAKYQEHPNANGQHCGVCNYYLPGKTPTAIGQCKLVAGAINPNGWCQLFAPKRG
jgi:hypothetical protein